MTLQEFNEQLRALMESGRWALREDYWGVVRLHRVSDAATVRGPERDTCPVSAVAAELTGRWFDSYQYVDAAAVLGLSYRVARAVAYLADYGSGVSSLAAAADWRRL